MHAVAHGNKVIRLPELRRLRCSSHSDSVAWPGQLDLPKIQGVLLVRCVPCRAWSPCCSPMCLLHGALRCLVRVHSVCSEIHSSPWMLRPDGPLVKALSSAYPEAKLIPAEVTRIHAEPCILC